MTSANDLPVEVQFMHLLEHLGLARAHVVGNMMIDFGAFVRKHPDLIASLTLLCPNGVPADFFDGQSFPQLIVTGEQGPLDAAVQQQIIHHTDHTLVTLREYDYKLWSDVVTDRSVEIGAHLLAFLQRVEATAQGAAATLENGNEQVEGRVDEIHYAIAGSGPPLVLLPLALAPQQWHALLPTLQRHFTTIQLTGRALGFVGFLERRGNSAGYLEVVGNLLRHATIQPGETVLEVGCGTGVLMRWLARRTAGANPITAVDLNRQFLRDAEIMAQQEGIDSIKFQEAHAEQLSFPDNSFDVTICCTVLEEVDATRALAEIVRVTKVGGRIAVLVRARDIQRIIHLPLPNPLRTKLETPGAWGGGVGAQGCADGSLYQRMRNAGAINVLKLPLYATADDVGALKNLENNILPLLNAEELAAWQRAVEVATRDESFFCSAPFHGGVGTKPAPR